jgi:predicted transcriptional regulator
MSTITVEIPDSLKKGIEELAARDGYSVSQFLASAASEKLAVLKTVDFLKSEAAKGRRGDFEKYLASVPKIPPAENDRLD